MVDGVISLNTGVHLSEGTPLPSPLRAALSGPVLPMATVLTDGFFRTTLSLGQGPLPAGSRTRSAPPIGRPTRSGIGAFVADIPAGRPPSYDELQQLAEDIAALHAPPCSMWGPKDPVFVEHFLRDLRHRLPHADVHRVEKASAPRQRGRGCRRRRAPLAPTAVPP